MKKYFSMLAMATVLFASSCNKTTENVTLENNETPITLSPEFAELQNSLYELNQEMVPSFSETRGWPRFPRWILFGLADGLGGLIGHVGTGSVSGGIQAGTKASTWAYEQLFPEEQYSESINAFRPIESEFDSMIATLNDQQAAQVGILHNYVIRKAYDEVGDSLFEMTPEEMEPVFMEALPDEYRDDLPETSVVSYDVQDFVYSPESGETTNEFIFGICEKYPEAAQEILTVVPILEALDASTSDKAALKYITRAMKMVECSKVTAKSKSAILCGASVAFESKMLWNIPENQNN